MVRRKSIPSYRLHKASGQAVVTLTCSVSGTRKDVYLGDHDTPASRKAYAKAIAEWLDAGRVVDRVAPQRPANRNRAVKVRHICALHWRNEKRRRGVQSGDDWPTELYTHRSALRICRAVAGDTAAGDFGPLTLQRVRKTMIDRGWKRPTINKAVRIIVGAFRHAVSQEVIAPEIVKALECVQPLRSGEHGIPDSDKVYPVSDGDIAAVKPHVGRQIAALIHLQLLTGARAGELVIMRPMNLDTSGKVWTYTPAKHKTKHHGHERIIAIGPAGQKIVKQFLNRPTDAYLFSPREAEQERRQAMREQRTAHPSTNRRRDAERAENPRERTGDRYTTASYRRAIERACAKAKIPAWTPHRLRHTAATRLRKQYGLEAARLVLGHRSATTTEIYAEADRGKVVDIIGKVG